MHCASCANIIKDKVSKLNGVKTVDVNFATETAKVEEAKVQRLRRNKSTQGCKQLLINSFRLKDISDIAQRLRVLILVNCHCSTTEIETNAHWVRLSDLLPILSELPKNIRTSLQYCLDFKAIRSFQIPFFDVFVYSCRFYKVKERRT